MDDWLGELPLWSRFHGRIHDLLVAMLASKSYVYGVESRVKSIEAITQKMHLLGVDDLSSVADVVGFQIIVHKPDDLKAATDVLRSEFEIPSFENRDITTDTVHFKIAIGERRKDLAEWAPFRECHAEVQILTVLAHAWQQVTHALRYKSVTELRAALPFGDHLDRLNEIVIRFEEMLSRSNIHEKRDIHPFLNKHRFLLYPNPEEIFSEVAIGLGTEYRIDFLIREPDGVYLLVEIENSRHDLFTQAGDFTAPVNHAQRQIEDWQEWIEENLSTVQKAYPGMSSPRGLVVIGRSAGLSASQRRRLHRRNVNLRGRLTIWTYDHLLNQARQFIASIGDNLGEARRH